MFCWQSHSCQRFVETKTAGSSTLITTALQVKPMLSVLAPFRWRLWSPRSNGRCCSTAKKSSLNPLFSWAKENIVNCSAAISVSQAVDNLTYVSLYRHHELLQTFNPTENIGIRTQSMAQNITGSRPPYSNLRDLYLTSDSKGLLAILSMPSSQCSSKQPSVTRIKRIIGAILNHFHETTPREEWPLHLYI